MTLTVEQLETIKVKIETDKILPIKAIRELFPDGDVNAIRKQLFSMYDIKELRSHFTPPSESEPSTEEKLAQINQQLQYIEQRKANLLQQKVALEAQ